MGYFFTNDINETFVIEPLSLTGGAPTVTACTALYTSSVVSCTGDTQILLSNGVIIFDGNLSEFNNVSSNSLSATTIYSGGTDLFGIILGTSQQFTLTGGTFNQTTDILTLSLANGNNINISGLTDVFVTGGTYNNSNGSITFTNNTGGTFSVTGLYTGYTLTTSAITSTLGYTPLSSYTDTNTFTTGATYSNGTLLLKDNSGNTITATGFYTGATDVFVTGGTYSNGNLSLLNNTGGTFTVSGFKTDDIFVTGGTFINDTKILTYTRNDNQNINVSLPFLILNTKTGQTISNQILTIDTITGITDNSNNFIVSYVTAYKDNNDYGFWKRTIAINKVSGVVNIIGENSDFDRLSSGMTPNSVIYSANSGNISIIISGETSKNYNWSSNWEIIK